MVYLTTPISTPLQRPLPIYDSHQPVSSSPFENFFTFDVGMEFNHSDDYKTQSDLYDSYRPQYPDDFIRKIASSVPKGGRKLAVDVGCGTGVLTRQLAPFFTHVVGIDTSRKQIEVAKESSKQIPNISFSVGDAYETKEVLEQLGFPTKEVSIVTAAESFHWLDTTKFVSTFVNVFPRETPLALIGYLRPFLSDVQSANENSSRVLQKSDNSEYIVCSTEDKLDKFLVKYYNRLEKFTGFDWNILITEYECYRPEMNKFFKSIEFGQPWNGFTANLNYIYSYCRTMSTYHRYYLAHTQMGGKPDEDVLLVLVRRIMGEFGYDLKGVVLTHQELCDKFWELMESIELHVEFRFFYYVLRN